MLDQTDFLESNKKEFIRLNSKIEELMHENERMVEAKNLLKSVYDSIKIMDT